MPHLNGSKLIYIAALPKSASSLVWLIVSALQERDGRANPTRQQGRLPHPLLPLTWDILERFPEGGTYKSHAPIFATTAGFLQLTRSKHVVLLRHPADFVPALYCHLLLNPDEVETADGTTSLPPEIGVKLGSWMGEKPTPDAANVPWIDTISPIRRSVLAAGVPLSVAMAHFIADGVLLKSMQWMTDWLQYRDKEMSIVVTYEELMGEFEATIERISTFVRGEPANDDVMAYLRHVTRAVAEEGHAKPSSRYPRGWTGSVGIWRQYFSDHNIRSYHQVVEGFLSNYPHAAELSRQYPDLLIDPTRPALEPAVRNARAHCRPDC